MDSQKTDESASQASVDEDISISMCTERILRAFEYDYPGCIAKAMRHLDEHKPIPLLKLSAGRQTIDTYVLLSLTLNLAPTPTGQTYIAAFIMACKTGDEFLQFATSLFWELFVPVKSCGGRTPVPTRSASSDSIPFYPRASEREAVRLKCLMRCNFECPITKKVDKLCTDQSRAEYITLEAAHILPFSLNKFDEADEMLAERRRRAWSALQHFCGETTLQEELSGRSVNSLKNIIAFQGDVHKMFGEFRLWLRPSQNVDSYVLAGVGLNNERVYGRQLIGFPNEVRTGDIVKLVNVDPTVYESVDSRLLNIHASLAEILHLSGAGEKIERILRDLDDTKCLAKDGSSTEELVLAINQLIVAF